MSQVIFKDNPNYVVAFEKPYATIYMPADIVTGYHLSREVAAGAQEIYSKSGTTRDLLRHFMKEIIEMCNSDKPSKTFRTDVGVIANNILYRTDYPVDEECSVRMGAILSFMEGEDPDKVQNGWTRKKIQLANEYPDLYDFFLLMGIQFTPSYRESFDTSTAMEYFQKRAEVLRGLTPRPSQTS